MNTDLAMHDLDGGRPVTALSRVEDVPIGAILNAAVDRGVSTESMEKIVALYERMADRKAAQEFAEAMAGFQSSCPPIAKNATAKITTRAGGEYGYSFASLDFIAKAIAAPLKAHGLSYSWDSEEDGGRLRCTCTVFHVNGHSRTSRFSCTIDTAAAMSGPQKSAAALTFARRQSLVQALGLTTGDPDQDGAGRPSQAAQPITPHQAANIDAMLDELKVDRARFGNWLRETIGCENVADIPASAFKSVIASLEAKRKGVK